MSRYRKKPVVIEAFKYDGNFKTQDEKYYVPNWAVTALENRTMFFDKCELYINTLEGKHHVSVGDYIIRGIKGELYPCKPDIFKNTYEKIKSSEE